MKEVKTVYFKIDTEGISSIFRDQFWYEGKTYESREKLFLEMFPDMPAQEAKELAYKILTGQVTLKGTYPDDEIKVVDIDLKEKFFKIKTRNNLKLPNNNYFEKLTNELYEPIEKRVLTNLVDHELGSHELDNSIIFYMKSLAELKSAENTRNIKLMGICKNPKIHKPNCYAACFEGIETFEKHWFHINDFMIDKLQQEAEEKLKVLS